MFLSNQTQSSGQSWTLDVHKDPKTGETVVRCPAVPDLETRDSDQLYAVQSMRRLLDEHANRNYQGESREFILPGALRDED
jgi:hypothetical protein